MFLKIFLFFIFFLKINLFYCSDIFIKVKNFISNFSDDLKNGFKGKFLDEVKLKKIITNYSKNSINNKIALENYRIINSCLSKIEKLIFYKDFFELNKNKYLTIEEDEIKEFVVNENGYFKVQDIFEKVENFYKEPKEIKEKIKETIKLNEKIQFLEMYLAKNIKKAEGLNFIKKKIDKNIENKKLFEILKVEESIIKPENYEILSNLIDLNLFFRKNFSEEDKEFLLSRNDDRNSDHKINLSDGQKLISKVFEEIKNIFSEETSIEKWKKSFGRSISISRLEDLKNYIKNYEIAKKIFLNEKKEKKNRREEIFREIEFYIKEEIYASNKKNIYRDLASFFIILQNYKFSFDGYYLSENEKINTTKRDKIEKNIIKFKNSNKNILINFFNKKNEEQKKNICYKVFELEYILKEIRSKIREDNENFLINSFKKLEITYAGVTGRIKENFDDKKNEIFFKNGIDAKNLNFDLDIKIFTQEEREILISHIEKKEYESFLNKIFENKFFLDIFLSKTIKPGSFKKLSKDDKDFSLELKTKFYDLLFLQSLDLKDEGFFKYSGYYNTISRGFNYSKDLIKNEIKYIYKKKFYFSLLGLIIYYFPEFKKKYMKKPDVTYKMALKNFLQDVLEEFLLIREKIALKNNLKKFLIYFNLKNDEDKLKDSTKGESKVKLSKGIFSF